MFACRFSIAAVMATGLLCAAANAAAPLSPLVDLNTDTATNVLLNGSTVKVWYDAASDGTTPTQQDFGQNTASRQPTWATDQTMPNGINRTLIDFTGGGSGGDYLTSKIEADARIADVPSTFNLGGDPAYLMDGVSWFSVFRTDNNNGAGETSATQSRQYVWSTVYATPTFPGGFQDIWGTSLVEAADANDDIINVQNTALGDPDLGVVNNAGNAVPNVWYIVGNSWDPATQTFKSRVLNPNTLTSSTVIQDVSSTDVAQAPNLASGYTNNFVRIGQSSNSATSPNQNREFNGEMAEMLLYNRGLSASEFDTVMTYLERKFFLAQPGDFDGDQDVDGADFVAWQTNFPTASDATLADGDADGDGDVDGADFVVWQTNFPTTPSPGIAPVPEPTSGLLVGIALLACGLPAVRRWSAG